MEKFICRLVSIIWICIPWVPKSVCPYFLWSDTCPLARLRVLNRREAGIRCMNIIQSKPGIIQKHNDDFCRYARYVGTVRSLHRVEDEMRRGHQNSQRPRSIKLTTTFICSKPIFLKHRRFKHRIHSRHQSRTPLASDPITSAYTPNRDIPQTLLNNRIYSFPKR